MTMQKKITVLILLAGVIPLLVIVGIAHYMAQDSLVAGTLGQLESIRDNKKSAVEGYFKQRKKDIALLVKAVENMKGQPDPGLEKIRAGNQKQVSDFFNKRIKEISDLAAKKDLGDSMATLDWVFRQADRKAGGEKWTQIANKRTPWLDRFRKAKGYEDLYLISQRGNVFYTSARGPDLGTNVKLQTTKNSPLGQLLVKALKGTTFQDQLLIKESGKNSPAFIAAPVKRNGGMVGIIAVSLDAEKLLKPVLSAAGLSKGGALYLAGTDKKWRAGIIVGQDKDQSAYPISRKAVQQALAGNSSSDTVEADGYKRLATWQPVMVGTQRWAIVTEVPTTESSADSLSQKGLDKKYLDESGYYDLFLIKPDGMVAHTAAKQRDYGTNLLTGPYADSNLAELLRTVLKSKKPGMTDVAPYAPSNGEPAAFIAAPLLQPDGAVKMVVALQLPLEGLTQILSPTDSLKDKGDIYLVGPDKLMRSDSNRSPETHSVSASFNGSVENNGRDSKAVIAALAGKTGTLSSDDKSTFYAYTPITFDAFNWALVLETNSTGSGGAISDFISTLTIVCFGFIPLVALLAWMGAKSTVSPLAAFSNIIDQLSQGNFALDLQKEQKGNMGNLGNQVIDMTERLAHMTMNIRQAAMALIQQGQELAKTTEQQKQNTFIEKPAAKLADYSKISTAIQNLEVSLAQEGRESLSTEQSAELTTMDIAEGSQSISEAISASRNVSERIFVIEENTRQLRLMAMNAAVEAARSGAPGEAFVETAKEMRKLAEKSRVGASEIHRLSTSNTRGTKQAGETLASLSPGIRNSIDLIYKQSSNRTEQREALNRLLEEVKALTQEQPAIEQEEQHQQDMPSSPAVEHEIAKLNQKAEALLEALASFIPPDEE
jgi:methyl-accepting chemotaxis protein